MQDSIQKCIEKLFLLNDLIPYQLYMFGSRLYGTAKENSDYDFFLIVSDEHFLQIIQHYQTISNSPCTGWNFETLIREQYQVLNYVLSLENQLTLELNINLYSMTQFVSKLEENWIQSLICCCIPKNTSVASFAWHCTLSPFHFSDFFFIYYPKMGRSAVAEASKHWELAKKTFSSNSSNSIYKAKKYLIHSLRDLLLGIQLAKYDQIVNYSIANHWYEKIVADEQITSIETAEAKYLKEYQRLKQELNQLVQPTCEKRKQEALLYRNKVIKPTVSTFLIQLIQSNREHWSTLLKKWYCISSVTVATNVYFLYCDAHYSPHYSQEVIESGHGIVLEVSEQICRIVSQPISTILEHTNHFAPCIAWKENSKAYAIPTNSTMVSLFYYQGNWNCYTATEFEPIKQKQELFAIIQNKQFSLQSLSTEFTYTFCIFETNVFLYGMRNNSTGLEESPSRMDHLVPKYALFNCTKLEIIQEHAQTLDPFFYKEMIVEDKFCHRLRIIPSQTIALSQLQNWLQYNQICKTKEEEYKVCKWFWELLRSNMNDYSSIVKSIQQVLLKDKPELKILLQFCVKRLEEVRKEIDKIFCQVKEEVEQTVLKSNFQNENLFKKNQIAKWIELVEPIKKEKFPTANLIYIMTSMFELQSCSLFFQKQSLKVLLPCIEDLQ